jgi:outer membrane protein assembly factor BamA
LHIPAKLNLNKWKNSLFERGARGDFDRIDEYKSTFIYGKIPFETNFGISNNIPLRYGIVLEGEARDNELGSDIPKNYQDGFYLGGGYLLVLDKKDNDNWPTKGYYASFEEIFFGGDFSYHTETFDARFYAPLFWETSIALGLYAKQSRGDNVPLGCLAGPDGTKRFRGVESGIWSDTQALIWQMEFRRPLFWRFAGVIFGEALQSAPYFSELFRRQVHYAVGFGGRLALNKSEKLHARGDLSLVDGKHIGITIDLRESF